MWEQGCWGLESGAGVSLFSVYIGPYVKLLDINFEM